MTLISQSFSDQQLHLLSSSRATIDSSKILCHVSCVCIYPFDTSLFSLGQVAILGQVAMYKRFSATAEYSPHYPQLLHLSSSLAYGYYCLGSGLVGAVL